MIVKLPPALPVLSCKSCEARTRPAAGEGGLAGRHPLGGCLLAWGREGEGPPSRTPRGFPPAVRQPFNLPAYPDWALTPAGRVWAMDISAVEIWVQSAVDAPMHLEHFQKLCRSKLYLMESMHSKQSGQKQHPV